ncbi:MAG TPA: hypothetical protein VGN57_03910 [Pirellulaceae bacterium]|jgi:hypothetical protein|nr:hypothetical protein [Pirellulaceae bacterium]
MIRFLRRLPVVAALSALLAASVCAQLPDPRLKSIFPAGGARGAEVEATISGTDLDDATTLVFTHSGIVAAPKTEPRRPFETEPQVVADKFMISIAGDVPPGLYEVRSLGRFGLSTPRSFAVGVLPETIEAGNPQSLETAMPISFGSVVNGRAGNEAYDYFRFPAKAGEKVSLRCEAARLDSPLIPRLELLDATGALLAVGQGEPQADATLDVQVPTDGDYVAKLFDAMYRGGDEFVYRLTVAALPRADSVFPPVATPGASARFEILGRELPGAAPVPGASESGLPLERTEAEIAAPAVAEVPDVSALGGLFEVSSADVAGFLHRIETPAGPSEPFLLGYATAPIVQEIEAGESSDAAQPVEAPCEIVGTLPTARDRDRFTFRAKAGERFAVEALSQRLGQPTDLEMVIEQLVAGPDGATTREIAAADDVDRAFGNPPFDRQARDPALLFVADGDGEYRVSVRDLAGGSNPDPRRTYALAIRPPAPDFRLVATVKSFAEAVATGEAGGATVLRKGGTAVVVVQVVRRDGFDGAVTLSATDLPAGVTTPPVIVGPARNLAMLVFSAAPDAAASQGPIRILGEATIAGASVRRSAVGAVVVREKDGRTTNAVTRLTASPMLSVIADEAPLSLEIAGEANVSASRAGKIWIPIRVIRRAGAKGAVDVGIDGAAKEIVATALSIPEGTTDARLELKLDAKAPLGAVPFVLTAKAQVAYSRNPEAAAVAAAKLAALDATIAKLTAENADPEILKAADEERKVLEKRSQDLAKAAEPKDVAVVAHSLPVTVTIAEAPFEATPTPPAQPIARGSQAEIVVDVARSFGFADAVELDAVIPADFAGIAIEKATLPPEATQAKLVVKAAADGSTGEVKLTLRASGTYDGTRLQIERPLALTIGPPAAATP